MLLTLANRNPNCQPTCRPTGPYEAWIPSGNKTIMVPCPHAGLVTTIFHILWRTVERPYVCFPAVTNGHDKEFIELSLLVKQVLHRFFHGNLFFPFFPPTVGLFPWSRDVTVCINSMQVFPGRTIESLATVLTFVWPEISAL